jgi:hypothetical protein
MQSRHRSIERAQPNFTRSLSKRLTQSMDRGLQNEETGGSETPNSNVNSAAFNHFNKMKPHMSNINVNQQSGGGRGLRELDEDDTNENGTGDYNVHSSTVDPYQQQRVRGPAFQQQQSSYDDRFPSDTSQNFSNRSNQQQQHIPTSNSFERPDDYYTVSSKLYLFNIKDSRIINILNIDSSSIFKW